MEDLKRIKDMLVAQVQTQMGDLHNVDAKELGEVVDMIKDLDEAIYYCTITKAMEETYDDKNNTMYYSNRNMGPGPKYYTVPESYMMPDYQRPETYRDMDRDYGKMYYHGDYPRDTRMEGRSPMQRKMYMEMKDRHSSTERKMEELEKYMKELSEDITDMIEGSSPEEKKMLKEKITALASKI